MSNPLFLKHFHVNTFQMILKQGKMEITCIHCLLLLKELKLKQLHGPEKMPNRYRKSITNHKAIHLGGRIAFVSHSVSPLSQMYHRHVTSYTFGSALGDFLGTVQCYFFVYIFLHQVAVLHVKQKCIKWQCLFNILRPYLWTGYPGLVQYIEIVKNRLQKANDAKQEPYKSMLIYLTTALNNHMPLPLELLNKCIGPICQ